MSMKNILKITIIMGLIMGLAGCSKAEKKEPIAPFTSLTFGMTQEDIVKEEGEPYEKDDNHYSYKKSFSDVEGIMKVNFPVSRVVWTADTTMDGAEAITRDVINGYAVKYGSAEKTSIDINMTLHWSDETTDIWLNSKSDRNPSSPIFKTGSIEWDISQKTQ